MPTQPHNFTLLKTTLLGLALSAICAVAVFYRALNYHALPRGQHIWSYEFNNRVTWNPEWWITVLGSFAVAFIIARKTRQMLLWIAVALTGCCVLYLALAHSLRYLLRNLN
jgi:hypothetical protein